MKYLAHNIFHFALKIINCIIPKSRKRVFAIPHINGMNDRYDLINSNSDNLLTVLDSMIQNERKTAIKLFIICYDKDRISTLERYVSSFKNPNIRVKFLLSEYVENNTIRYIIRRINNSLFRYTCRTWLSDTGYCVLKDKLPWQKYICLNYCTPLKTEVRIEKNWNFSYIDTYVVTSKMCSFVEAAEYMMPYFNTAILGFPRNDNLINNDKTKAVYDWIRSRTSESFEHIIVYAPTYREYEGAYDQGFFGYNDEEEIIKALNESKTIAIVKYHPLQKYVSNKTSNRIIIYEKTYDFGLYDLLAYSDMLISDYSSVIHDYVLTNKSVVMNLFDYEKYDQTRGLAFEPIEIISPGDIVTSARGLAENIRKLKDYQGPSEKYISVTKMFHRYTDSKSTQRCIDFILNNL